MFEPREFVPATGSASTLWLEALQARNGSPREFRSDTRFAACPEPVPADPAHAESEAIAALLAEAREDGRREGHAAGLTEAAKDSEERRRLGSAIRALDEAMAQQLADLLAQTVRSLCEATLRPLALDNAQLQRRCRKAADMLETERRNCVLHLCAADIARLDEDFRQEWTIREDDALAPGDLRIESGDGAISDGPGEWSRHLAEALDAC